MRRNIELPYLESSGNSADCDPNLLWHFKDDGNLVTSLPSTTRDRNYQDQPHPDHSLTNIGHFPVIDLDIPCRLVPSRTEGHYHLYIDQEVPTGRYWALMQALADAGLVEPGYVSASIKRGFTSVRREGTFEPHSLSQAGDLF